MYLIRSGILPPSLPVALQVLCTKEHLFPFAHGLQIAVFWYFNGKYRGGPRHIRSWLVLDEVQQVELDAVPEPATREALMQPKWIYIGPFSPSFTALRRSAEISGS